jgi:hypothetical protein
MSQGVRYKFIGSTIQVGIDYDQGSSATAITAITVADPAVVTASGHTAALGDVVKLTGIVGATQFNDNLYAVDDPTGTTFELAGEDNSMGAAWVSGGFVHEVTFSEFCELTGAAQAGGGADQEEVSTVCSTAKEFEQGLSDAGTLTLDFNFAPLTTVQTVLRASEVDGSDVAVKITLPNDGGIVIMLGAVQTTSFNGAIGQAIWKGNAVIKLSGPIFVLDPAE